MKSYLLIKIFSRIFSSKKTIRKRTFPQGQYYNLQEIYHTLNAKYFDSKLDLHISWFGNRKIPKTRITFGSYNHSTKSIRINRLLDQTHMPSFVVEFIVYHEMLHNILPPKRKLNGKRSIHHQDFKEKERQFPEYRMAKDFIKSWLRDSR